MKPGAKAFYCFTISTAPRSLRCRAPEGFEGSGLSRRARCATFGRSILIATPSQKHPYGSFILSAQYGRYVAFGVLQLFALRPHGESASEKEAHFLARAPRPKITLSHFLPSSSGAHEAQRTFPPAARIPSPTILQAIVERRVLLRGQA